MKIKTLLILATALCLNKLGAQCFSISDNVGGQICLGQSAQLFATQSTNCPGTLTYSWYPWGHIGNNFVITPIVTTQYTVVASNNTQLVGTIVVNQLPAVVATANPPVISNAPPGNVSNITLSGATTYYDILNNTAVSSNFNVSPAVTANYAFTGVDANGCSGNANVLVTVQNLSPSNPCTGCGASVASVLNGGIVSGMNCVNNNVAINGVVTISNADLAMASGVMITINSGSHLILNNSHLFACNDMWQGIELKNGGMLTMTDCLIEDAIEAIDVTSHTNQTNFLTVSNTTFNKNNVAIDINNYVQQIPIYPFDIQNCLFTCRDIPYTPLTFPLASVIAAPATNPEAPLSNAYIDNSVYLQTGANAMLKAPYAGLKPEAGIRLTDVGVTLNPGTNATTYFGWEHGGTSSRNIFDNLQKGINMLNANASIYNSVFQNSSFGVYCVATPGSHNSLRVTSPPGTQNMFVDCENGIDSHMYYNQVISQADFRTTLGSALGIVNSPAAIRVATNRYKDCRIEDNSIYNVLIGIYTAVFSQVLQIPGVNLSFGSFVGSMYINRNTIKDNVTGNTTTYQSLIFGIQMEMIGNFSTLFIPDPNTQILQVDKNDIANAYGGIQMDAFAMPNVSCNSNNITLAPNASWASWGISFNLNSATATKRSQIANNVIVGFGNSNPNNVGIRFGACNYQDITCNYVSNTTKGYEFNSLNTNINFSNNEMNSNQYGMILDWYGELGTQGSSSNPQDNRWSGLWPSGTYKTAVFGGSDATNSKFYLRSSLSGPYNPDGSSISTTAPTNNTEYSLANGNLIVSTSAPALAFCPIVPSTARMMQGGTYVDLPQLTAFANRKPHPNSSIEFIKRSLIYELANAQGYKPIMNDSVSVFYNEIDAGNVGTFKRVEKALFGQNLTLASQINQSVKTGNEAEKNTKTYYRIAINHFKGTLTAKDSADLNQLVTKCPYTDGLIVINARTLYQILYGPKLFANNCTMDQSIEVLGISDISDAASIQLFPNPTSGVVNLVTGFGNQAVELSVRDITGRCIYKKMHQLEEGKTQFNLDCASGAYLVTLSTGEQKANIKLIIQK